MKEQKLFVLEVGSGDVSEAFYNLVGREPTDVELERVCEEIGDIYSALDLFYLADDIRCYIEEVIERLNF